MTKRTRTTTFIFEQQLQSDYWDWSDDKKALFDDWEVNKQAIFQEIYDRVKTIDEENPIKIGLIVHDKDISFGSRLVKPHVHGYIEFKTKRDLNVLALNLGLLPQYIEPSGKGRYGKINSKAYLIHAKNPDKYQYEASEVETFDTFDYEQFIAENTEDFAKQSATRKREKADESLDLVLSKVQRGELNYLEVMEDDELAFLFANNQQKFRESFNFFGERETVLRLKDLKRGDYQLTVLYIQGEPGIGKTHLANELILKVSERLREHDLKGEYYPASSKNPFDNYYGEEILFLDDLREDSLSASDWLKLFDPLNSARMSARYQNKLVVPRLIVMTAYMSPKQFFGSIKTEDLNQYLRRVNFSTEIAKKHGMEDTFYSVSEVKKHKANDHYQRSDGSSVVLNFNYEDLYSSQNKDEFITKLLEEYIYPRILPKKAKDVTNAND